MTEPTIARWREPKTRITLTLEVFDEPLTIRVGTMQFDASRWARLRIEGKPNARWKASDSDLEHVEHICESWCALDGGRAGTTFLTDQYARGMSPDAAFWWRTMSLRAGAQWLFEDFLSTPAAVTRIDALRLVTLLPETLLGEQSHRDHFEADYWASPDPEPRTYASEPVDIDAIASSATDTCRAAVAISLVGGTLGELIAARLHTRRREIDEYTGDTHDEAWLNVLAHVRVGHRDTRMVFSFPYQDISAGYQPLNDLARSVLTTSAAHDTSAFLTLIAPTTPVEDALRFPPLGSDLNVSPPEQTLNVWQTEWAHRLFGEPS